MGEIVGVSKIARDLTVSRRQEALLKAVPCRRRFSIAPISRALRRTRKGVIQIFAVGAERMLGYAAADVMNKITPADISDPQELITRRMALSVELGTPITPGSRPWCSRPRAGSRTWRLLPSAMAQRDENP